MQVATPLQPTIPIATAPTNTLPGFNVLLEGEAGMGKTYSIGTLVETGLEVFFLAMEPGYETLYGYFTDRGQPIPPNLHVHFISPPKASFDELIRNAEMVNTLSFKALLDYTDPNRGKYNQHILLLRALNNFIDERTGEAFGPVDKWGTDRVLVIDPLTGINRACMELVIGGKAAKDQKDWGLAQDQVERILRMLTDSCRCNFVLLAHVEREIDQVQGGSKITVSTLGKALAPKIPSMFSDVIYAYREVDHWYWSTANNSVALKTRNLPIADKLQPDFKQIVEKWKGRQK